MDLVADGLSMFGIETLLFMFLGIVFRFFSLCHQSNNGSGFGEGKVKKLCTHPS
jgi:hypothetical protein